MSRDILVFVGTYTTGKPGPAGVSEGIYSYRFDPANGALSLLGVTKGIANPSFVRTDPSGRRLYAVCEVSDTDGQRTGSVSAYAVDRQAGSLELLNRQPSHGAGPCYVTVDPEGEFVLVANYSAGSMAMYPVQEDGRLGDASDRHQFEGQSVNPKRQKGPHAHSVAIDPAGRYVFVQDLGTDKVMQFRLDRDRGVLVPNDEPFLAIAPDAGPRHFAFHPSGAFGYLINELDNTVTACAYDAETGRLRVIQTVPTLPPDFAGTSHTADIHVAASGKFLYGSNRGHDSIAIFGIDAESGELTPAGHEPTGGETPRNFALDPTGQYLLAANQGTDSIVTFRIDPETGGLAATGQVTQAPKPVCLEMIEV